MKKIVLLLMLIFVLVSCVEKDPFDEIKSQNSERIQSEIPLDNDETQVEQDNVLYVVIWNKRFGKYSNDLERVKTIFKSEANAKKFKEKLDNAYKITQNTSDEINIVINTIKINE